MSDIMPFEFDGHQVRVVMIDGKPWFVAADIAEVLGYASAHQMIRVVRDHQKGRRPMATPGGVQDMWVISRAGLSRLVMRSDKEDAERFQDWVTDEVLESIAETGTYGLERIDLPTALERYAKALRDQSAATARAIEAEAYINEVRPKAIEYDRYMDSDGLCALAALGQALGGGRQRLVDRLRELKILVSRRGSQLEGTRPMQPYLERGWFEVKIEVTEIGTVPVTYVTPKGVSGVFRALVEHGVGRRWDKPLPTEEELFKKLVFKKDAS